VRRRGRPLALIAAVLTTLMLWAAFASRCLASGQAVAEGGPKRFAATLISAWLVAALLSLVKLIRCSR